jgi:ferric-dicitrate binding protein FerR (iron transport regulator)
VATTPQQPDFLFNRLLEGELSPQDTEAVIAWLGSKDLDPATAEMIMKQLQQSVAQHEISPEISAALEARLPHILKQPKEKPASIFRTTWIRYAAAVVIALISVFFFLIYKQQATTKRGGITNTPLKFEVAPGKDGAILTLDDGSTVVLDSIGNGVVATQNGSKVLLKNGQLVYNKDGSAAGSVTYNTMSTPKGRQFRLVLQDGTKVWLNAASSIRYPTVFTGKERKVEVTGEVYFEVTKNAKAPFHVKINDQTAIEVLGTHFNINSYTNESNINTTLLEGSVRVINGSDKVIIKPGQQAQVGKASKIKIVNDVNVDKVMAWKDGKFNFQDATLEEVMRQLERWYDIEVVYEKGVPPFEFIGNMGRDLTLSEVLRGLEMSKVHFRMEENRRVVVMP